MAFPKMSRRQGCIFCASLLFPDAWSTACRYAWECQTQEGGWGLDGCLREHSWKLKGIVNGIDYSEWSPENDPYLRSDGYMNYSQHDLAQGKAECKRSLQRVCTCPFSSTMDAHAHPY